MAVTLRVKYLGIDVEYNVPHLEDYSLLALFADVYMMACSEIPHADEMFKLEVKLAWTGEYRLIEDDRDLRDVFLVFKCGGLKAIRMHMESLPLTAVPPPSDHVPPPYEPGTNQSMPNVVCIFSSEEHNDVAAEQRTSAGDEESYTVLGKMKFEVGSSSSQPQKKKKKKTIPAQPPALQPQPQKKKKKKQNVLAKSPASQLLSASQLESSSQSVPISQSLQCSQPLSQNAPTDQST
ncbi:hypothetical protein ACOSQ3_021004 [Xanthoceras sorbifolium]